MKNTLRIATRQSPLALWQANYVKEQLQKRYSGIEIELIGIVTTADKMILTPLNKIGGKGLFVKELEQAILENRADIAVHSIKDMPAELPSGLTLTAVLKREDPRDAFVSNVYPSVEDLPKDAVVGTSSLRRVSQLLALRSDLKVKPLRGNVGTRLEKLDAGEFDALILASAGLKRLNQQARITTYFSTEQMLPAAGQGAIGIECRKDDSETIQRVSFLNHTTTRNEIVAERALTEKLGGSCQFPIASFAEIKGSEIQLRGFVGNEKGTHTIYSYAKGFKEQAFQVGLSAADDLIAQGALTLLQQVLGNTGNVTE